MSAPLAGLIGRTRLDPVLTELLEMREGTYAVSEAMRPYLLGAVASLSRAPVVLVVTPTSNEAERLAHDLRAFVEPMSVAVFPAWETLPFERVSPSLETMGQRLEVLHRLSSPELPAGLVVVASIKALLQRLSTAGAQAEPVVVRPGMAVSPGDLVEALVLAGYRREYQVEHRGEVALRGGIVDVFPSTGEEAVRIDCFGDEVDRLSAFELADQRSTRELEQVVIYPARELFFTDAVVARAGELAGQSSVFSSQFEAIAHREVFPGIESFLPWLAPVEHLLPDLLPAGSLAALIEPRRMRDRAEEILEEERSLAESLAVTWGLSGENPTEELPRLHQPFSELFAQSPARLLHLPAVAESPETPSVSSTGWPAALGDGAGLARRVGELGREGYVVVVAGESEASSLRLRSALETEGVVFAEAPISSEARPGVFGAIASVERGFVAPTLGLALLAEADVTGRRRPHRVPRARPRATEGFFDDLEVGSYVVHRTHGVARYAGMVRRELGGSARDYLLLEYRGGDRLYVPSDQIDSLTPYSGGESPSLNRLNGSEWQRQRARVRQAVQQIAQELVVLYQRRLQTAGFSFSSDSPWQAEMEQAFGYPETPDQARAIEDVKADMEATRPMDRLVCGDVGFGKTEVALRAAFKAVQDQKQVAVLVPTTLLAQQHFQRFSERFSPYPVRVEMLSRFLTDREAKEVIAGLAKGSVDVVIGTHRLLADDVSFSSLGLLVVDEEQRFGVSHKEAVKKMSVDVDVLTLTASPIPRTLEMGLTGIRDLSVINTPPVERQPILTYVGEIDERAVAEAIRRELLREGQVFFVHNRVQDIDRVAARVAGLVPEARVAIAHGQMDEGSLEKVVLDFSEGAYDVLVCTTIIESGIDMPTVNTLVVDRADLLGLGQLHQLRGRVGRAGQRAYAYLFHPVDKVLTEQAYERLRTIGEHTELGSGFKIAMRDLEIRGAGNLLGNDQSGHIAAVGYDLYVHMVAEAVAELKGEAVREPAEVKLELPLEAHLPAGYVEREDLRLEAYRRLASVGTADEVADIEREWLDRYGPLPAPAASLLSVARLRAECLRIGVRELTAVPERHPGRGGEVVARISPIELVASGRIRLSRVAPRAIFKEDLGQLIVPMRRSATLADDLIELLSGLVPEERAADRSA